MMKANGRIKQLLLLERIPRRTKAKTLFVLSVVQQSM